MSYQNDHEHIISLRQRSFSRRFLPPLPSLFSLSLFLLVVYLNERARERADFSSYVARISLRFSTFILARIAGFTGPTFHHEFSRYRARKVAKTCSRISFPSHPATSHDAPEGSPAGSLLHSPPCTENKTVISKVGLLSPRSR